MGGICCCVFKTGFDSVSGYVKGGNENDVALRTREIIGKGTAGGDTGGEVKGNEREATAGLAVEKGEMSEGDTLGPEPVERASGDV